MPVYVYPTKGKEKIEFCQLRGMNLSLVAGADA
jgi:hypothetical protein